MKKYILIIISLILISITIYLSITLSKDTLSIDTSNLEEKTLSSYTNITESGKYNIASNIEDTIYINTTGIVNLILNDVTINNIIVESGTLVITLNGTNTIIDNNTTNTTYDSVIYSEEDIYIEGDGTLTIESDITNIHSKSNIIIESGTFNLTSNNCDNIHAKDTLKITGGTFNLTTNGTDSTISSKGLKGTNEIIIDNGTFNINTIDDSLHSNNKITINGGTFTLSTKDDAIHSDNSLTINNGTINITTSYEGLESKEITINDGTINIVATDDGINASDGSGTESMQADDSILTINGGTITVTASGDGIDSNGNIVMTNGTLIIYGPTNDGNGSIDKNGTFKITGGTLLAGGSSGMAEMPTSGQNSVMINFNKTITGTIYIKKDNEVILSYTSSKSFNNLVLSSTLLETNEVYEVYIDNTFYTDFTVTSTSTKVGTSTNNMNNSPMRR